MVPRLIRRYADRDRMNHWFIVLLFLAAGLTGLAFFHPSLYFLSNLFGGGTWSRILHPFFGVLMVLGFALLFVRQWRANLVGRDDRRWLANAGALLQGHEERMPPAGKYNAGQKVIFWLMTVCLLVLLVTGFTFWQPWFAASFPILVRRIAVVLHAASAALLVIGVIVHVYAAIWVKGSMRAMTRGTVTEAWARQHHPLWAREVIDSRRAVDGTGP